MKTTTQKWNDEACAAACTEMKRMRALLSELENEATLKNREMNTNGRSVNWGTVSDMKRVNILLTQALQATGNESDALMDASIDLKVVF